MLEVRSTGELRSDGKKLHGYAAIFNSETDLGGFVEVIRNGAFRKSLESGSNIRALYHHQGDALLGTTRSKTLKLREDPHGLAPPPPPLATTRASNEDPAAAPA